MEPEPKPKNFPILNTESGSGCVVYVELKKDFLRFNGTILKVLDTSQLVWMKAILEPESCKGE